jgi:hypothetical protein
MKGILWNGKYFVLPQAASRIDSSSLNRVALGATGRLAILGAFTGLVPPGTVQHIGDSATALRIIEPRFAEARLAVSLAYDPTPGSEYQGASDVYLVPVNAATAATRTIDSKMLLTSYMYGVTANSITTKLETGTDYGKKMTVTYGSDIQVMDNLGSPLFTIQYTGADATFTLAITRVASNTLFTFVSSNVANNRVETIPSTTPVSAAMAIISSGGGNNVTAIAYDSTKLLSDIALTAATDVKTKAYYGSETTATIGLSAIVDDINKVSGYVSASIIGTATAPPANATAAALTGGADGTTTNQDWQNALDRIKEYQIDLVLPLTADPSVHAMTDAHVVLMSNMDNKSERRAFVGGALQTWTSEANRLAALATLKTSASALNSDRTLHAGIGSYHYDELGKLVLYPAYITAAMYAGLAAGNGPVMPLTRKYLRCYGLETKLRPAEVRDLIEAGIASPIPDTVNGAGYVISRQVTTWGQSDDLFRVEFSIGQGCDYIAREVRRRHEGMVGKPNDGTAGATLLNMTNSVLQEAKRSNLLFDYDPKKTVLRVDNTVVYVDYEAIPIMPINWVFSTFHLQPLTITITV